MTSAILINDSEEGGLLPSNQEIVRSHIEIPLDVENPVTR